MIDTAFRDTQDRSFGVSRGDTLICSGTLVVAPGLTPVERARVVRVAALTALYAGTWEPDDTAAAEVLYLAADHLASGVEPEDSPARPRKSPAQAISNRGIWVIWFIGVFTGLLMAAR